MRIKKAILPVGGLGTRFLPATKAQAKEMLAVFDKPVIQFIVEEAVESGVEDIVFVTGPGKTAIENHFNRNEELELLLQKNKKEKELAMVKKITNLANFSYTRQEEPLGDGHAILCALDFLKKDESVMVLFGDELVDNNGGLNAAQQMLEVYEKTGDPVVLLGEVDKEETHKYGIVELEGNIITSIVEKPSPENAPSNLGIVGKYILTPKLLKNLKTTMPGTDGEIRLANTIKDYIQNGGVVRGCQMQGKRFDTGDKIGFLEATLHYALKKENGKAKQILQRFLEED
ncbi:UTP--glucose-1-phosphate uridylyltransferase [Candidatus Gracilibacteria bacterium]|nr:UTP--glucose-1-phosphate uridylyltransferase [Candidatus Gracilibacteria bacterium]